MRLIFLLFFILQVISCSSSSPYSGQGKGRADRLSKEEREAIAPNDLFLAVLNGHLEQVRQILESSTHLLKSKNTLHGDSPLGLALDLGEFEIAKALFLRLSVEDYFVQNSNGEGLIFKAAQTGQSWMIKEAASNYYNSLGILEDYEFKDLDFENHEGQRALHVAKDAQVVLALEDEYYRGFLEVPFWQFSFKQDIQEKNFLHLAALESRVDVLRWAVSRFCGVSAWEKSGGWVKKNIAYLGTRLQRGVQTYIGGLGLGYDFKFNQQDLLKKTPLHYAVISKNLESLQVISSCEWVDYQLEDIHGDLPLHSFLKSISRVASQVSDEEIKVFKFLLDQRTQMKRWFHQKEDLINHQNHQGKSALHLAAELADERFFDVLSQTGNVELKDNEGLSPREIFSSRKQRVESYEH